MANETYTMMQLISRDIRYLKCPKKAFIVCRYWVDWNLPDFHPVSWILEANLLESKFEKLACLIRVEKSIRLQWIKICKYIDIKRKVRNVDHFLCRGQTALHKAAWYQRRTICCMLVEAKASLTRKDYQGNTPRMQALKADDRELAAYLESKFHVDQVFLFVFFLCVCVCVCVCVLLLLLLFVFNMSSAVQPEMAYKEMCECSVPYDIELILP